MRLALVSEAGQVSEADPAGGLERVMQTFLWPVLTVMTPYLTPSDNGSRAWRNLHRFLTDDYTPRDQTVGGNVGGGRLQK